MPTVADRIAQTVVAMALEPVLEPHFHPDSYGYRPGKSAIQALGVARQRCWRYNWVLDLDIKGFFGAPGKARRFPRVPFPPREEARHLTGNRVVGPWR
jgi:reverse transcriptase-like protein